jgi:hypothetical protein
MGVVELEPMARNSRGSDKYDRLGRVAMYAVIVLSCTRLLVMYVLSYSIPLWADLILVLTTTVAAFFVILSFYAGDEREK